MGECDWTKLPLEIWWSIVKTFFRNQQTQTLEYDFYGFFVYEIKNINPVSPYSKNNRLGNEIFAIIKLFRLICKRTNRSVLKFSTCSSSYTGVWKTGRKTLIKIKI